MLFPLIFSTKYSPLELTSDLPMNEFLVTMTRPEFSAPWGNHLPCVAFSEPPHQIDDYSK